MFQSVRINTYACRVKTPKVLPCFLGTIQSWGCNYFIDQATPPQQLSKAILPITVNELENLYIETFRLDFSPLIHCNKTEKAIIISTDPTVIVLSRLDKNNFLVHVKS